MFTLEYFGKFWIIISKVGGKLWRREGYMEQYLSDQNQLHIFNNDNFSISCKNADLSAVDNFFDNIGHPYEGEVFRAKHFWHIQNNSSQAKAGCTIVNTMVSSLCCIAKVEWKFEWSIEMLKLKTLCFSTISLRIAHISRQSVANKQEKEVIYGTLYFGRWEVKEVKVNSFVEHSQWKQILSWNMVNEIIWSQQSIRN